MLFSRVQSWQCITQVLAFMGETLSAIYFTQIKCRAQNLPEQFHTERGKERIKISIKFKISLNECCLCTRHNTKSFPWIFCWVLFPFGLRPVSFLSNFTGKRVTIQRGLETSQRSLSQKLVDLEQKCEQYDFRAVP